MDEVVISWLLEGDAAIRFQTQEDLNGVNDQQIQGEITQRGWGKKILDRQEEDGSFPPGIYRKWQGTFYSTLLLRRLCAERDNEACVLSANLLLEKGSQVDGGISYISPSNKKWKDMSELCMTGMMLSVFSYFRLTPEEKRIHKIADFLVRKQMDDGGWNCVAAHTGATHSSFHTTISVLEGLRDFVQLYDYQTDEILNSRVQKSINEGCEFLLEHYLYKSSTTRKVFDKKMANMAFPPRWRYDYLRGLDFFYSVDHRFDDRMTDALELLKGKRTDEGKWKLDNVWSGNDPIKMEKRGKPSRWNTLRAMRVLKKYGNVKKRRRRKVTKKSERGKKRVKRE